MLLRVGLKSLRASKTMNQNQSPAQPVQDAATKEFTSPFLTSISPEEVALVQAHRREANRRADERSTLIRKALASSLEGWYVPPENQSTWPGTAVVAAKLEKALIHYGLIKEKA